MVLMKKLSHCCRLLTVSFHGMMLTILNYPKPMEFLTADGFSSMEIIHLGLPGLILSTFETVEIIEIAE